MPRRILFSLLSLILLLNFLTTGLSAQISVTAQPPSSKYNLNLQVPSKRMANVNVARLLAEDSVELKMGMPLRFGYPFDVNYSLENSGTWEELPDDGRVWRLRIEVPDAYSTNLLYDHFYLPEGAQLFLYNDDKSMHLGAFTSKNNKEHGKFATGLLKGSICNLEYYEPADVRGQGIISISRVVHGYRNIFDREVQKNALDFGSSGPCNNNINCPEGAEWQQEKRAVAMVITAGGTRWCTGSMINNVRQDLTPYFLTANHCLGGEATWVFMFNYESPSCDNIDGPTYMTISGSTLLANSGYSDFALLELSVSPPDSFNVFYAGWNRADTASDSSVAIHHPRGDIKKISFDFDKLTESYYLQPTGNGDNHWRVGDWDDGTTEGGSSGSPLFDYDHHIVGQLHGGYAACGNDEPDWYGKFSKSWDYGTTPPARLKDWLDPDNTGVMNLNGREATGITIAHDPLPDTKDTLNDYTVNCLILAAEPLINDSLLLYYDVGFGWELNTLTPTAEDFEYEAFIPVQSPGTEISYYLYAADSTGNADSTEVFSFYVIDYALTLTPESQIRYAAVSDTIMYDLTIINSGIHVDKFDLSVSGASWTSSVMDTNGVLPFTQTGYMQPDDSVSFQVHVEIPTSNYMDNDDAYLVATSVTEPSIKDSVLLNSISGGEAFEIPFSDSFPSLTVDTDKWIYNADAEVSEDGIAENSAPYSLNLDGDPSGADTIISAAINLKSLESQTVSYYYQRTGGGDSPETGDDLKVEYQDAYGNWHNIGYHSGDGADMTKFEKTSLYLPDSAYHSAFRIRIFNKATVGDYDDWFIDDIFIGDPPPYDVSAEPYFQQGFAAETDSAIYLFTVTNDGTETDSFELVDSLNEWNISFYNVGDTTQISSTGNIFADSSLDLVAKVTVPDAVGDLEQDTGRVYIFSFADQDKRVHIQLNTISLGQSMDIPWVENIPDDSLSSAKWLIIDGAEASTAAVNTPDPPYSIHINNGPDTLVSRPINLLDKSDVYLSFYFERGGSLIPPEQYEDLVIEYRDTSGAWNGLTLLTGEDTAMTEFEFVRLALDEDALHKSFQLRLRTIDYGSAGDWFLDDIRIDQAPIIAVEPSALALTILAGNSDDTTLVMTNQGEGELIYNMEISYSIPDFEEVGDKSGGMTASLSSGGPDSSGYYFIDSDESGGPQFAWLEISILGSEITSQLDDDNYVGPFDLDFDFPYYGQSYNQLYVGSNGLIGFSIDSLDIPEYSELPSPEAPNNVMAWLWKDLDPTDPANPDAHAYIFADSSMVVVEFDGFPEKNAASGDLITAQVVLYKDGRIEYRYKQIEGNFDIDNASIGIENADGTDGLSVSFDQTYLHDSLTVLFYRQPEWFVTDHLADTLAVGEMDTIDCQFVSSDNMSPGIYTADLRILNNDPDNDTVVVTLELEVASSLWYTCGDANSDDFVDISDAVFIINFAFNPGSPAPDPIESGEVNCDGSVDISDAVFIINYAFAPGSPAPCSCK